MLPGTTGSRLGAGPPAARAFGPLVVTQAAWRGEHTPKLGLSGLATGADLLRRGELHRIRTLSAADRVQLRVARCGGELLAAQPPLADHARGVAEPAHQGELALFQGARVLGVNARPPMHDLVDDDEMLWLGGDALYLEHRGPHVQHLVVVALRCGLAQRPDKLRRA